MQVLNAIISGLRAIGAATGRLFNRLVTLGKDSFARVRGKKEMPMQQKPNILKRLVKIDKQSDRRIVESDRRIVEIDKFVDEQVYSDAFKKSEEYMKEYKNPFSSMDTMKEAYDEFSDRIKNEKREKAIADRLNIYDPQFQESEEYLQFKENPAENKVTDLEAAHSKFIDRRLEELSKYDQVPFKESSEYKALPKPLNVKDLTSAHENFTQRIRQEAIQKFWKGMPQSDKLRFKGSKECKTAFENPFYNAQDLKNAHGNFTQRIRQEAIEKFLKEMPQSEKTGFEGSEEYKTAIKNPFYNVLHLDRAYETYKTANIVRFWKELPQSEKTGFKKSDQHRNIKKPYTAEDLHEAYEAYTNRGLLAKATEYLPNWMRGNEE